MQVKTRLDSGELEEIINTGVTLVGFGAPWCAPCRAQEPVIRALAKQFSSTVRVLDLNVDDILQPAISMGITSIPTLIIFKDGKELQRFIGLQHPEVLSRAVADALR